MSWLSIHKRKAQNYGGSIYGEHRENNIEFVNQGFADSLSYLRVMVDNIEYDARFIITREYNDSSGVQNEKLILRPFTKLNAGQYAKFRNKHWLITFFNDEELTPEAHIRMCNKVLKFKNGNSYHCVADTNIRDYQRLLDLDKVTLPSDTMKITVSSNKDTFNVTEKDRFSIDGLAWQVQGIEKVSKTIDGIGIVSYAVTKVPLNQDEKDELVEVETIPNSEYHIKIVGKDEVEKGKDYQFKYELYEDGVLISTPVMVDWFADNGSIERNTGLFKAPNISGIKVNINVEYSYVDNVGEAQVVKATKQINIYDNNDWGGW